MATRPEETGDERQKRLQQEQHRPEQNDGYDEAVRGNPPVQLDITDTTATGNATTRSERLFDREAREAANDVRRRERSAD